MNEYIRELESFSDKMWLNKPEDIDRMLNRGGAKNKNFPVVLFARTDASLHQIPCISFILKPKRRKAILKHCRDLPPSIFRFWE